MSGEPRYYTNNKGERVRIYGGGSYDILNPIGDWFQDRIKQINQPLSPERQQRKEAQIRINDGQGTDADRRLFGVRKFGENKPQPEQKDEPTFGTPGINPRTGKPYSESPGKSSVAPDSDPKPTNISRDVDRDGAKGTQTSPSPAKPEAFDAVAARIQADNPGIRFNQDYQFQNENNGSQSNSLPGTPGYNPNLTDAIRLERGPEAGKTVYPDKGEYEQYASANEPIGLTGAQADPSVYEVDYFTGAPIAQGAQRGDSNAPDVGDQGTQIEGRLGEALDGVTAYDASKFKGDVNDPTMQNLLAQAKGRDRRGEAFLDGSTNSFEALRGAELAQGYITAGGEKYGRGKDGEMVKLNSEAVAALKADPNAVASQDFLAQYLTKPATPADQQSPDSAMPVGASTVKPEQLADAMSLGTPFFETDATKVSGISGYTDNPTGTGVDIRSPLTKAYGMREDVSEPAHNWQPTELDLEGSMYEAREPYMRYE